MMRELADGLEWGRHLCDMTPEEGETIIKALRFAADMERLVSAGEDPVFVLGHNCVWIDGYTVAELGPDIYTAARKAVEELEKGEGDARHKD